MTQPLPPTPDPTGPSGWPQSDGWPTPLAGPPQPPAPPTTGPGHGWYGFALALVVGAVLVCCGGTQVLTRMVDDPIATATIGETLTVEMGAEQDFAVLVKLDALMPEKLDTMMLSCKVAGPNDARFSWTQWEWLYTTVDGDWQIDQYIRVPGLETSDYEVTCTSNDPNVTDFGIAKAPTTDGQTLHVGGGLGMMLCCPIVLLVAAGITALVIRGKRRRASRGTEPASPAGPPPPPGPPPGLPPDGLPPAAPPMGPPTGPPPGPPSGPLPGPPV